MPRFTDAQGSDEDDGNIDDYIPGNTPIDIEGSEAGGGDDADPEEDDGVSADEEGPGGGDESSAMEEDADVDAEGAGVAEGAMAVGGAMDVMDVGEEGEEYDRELAELHRDEHVVAAYAAYQASLAAAEERLAERQLEVAMGQVAQQVAQHIMAGPAA